jgi:dipeptidyl aminopeptidase/acylaminoacyl peptidase
MVNRSLVLLCTMTALGSAQSPDTARRPMTWMDMQVTRNVGAPRPSPDKQWALYTISTPDWKEAKSQSDIHLVSLRDGVKSSRQMTFTREKDEMAPAWLPDGRHFAFLSNRDATPQLEGNQLFVMAVDGGEARRITSVAGGVAEFAVSPDSKWVAIRAGKSGEQQLHRLPLAMLDSAKPEALTKRLGGVERFRWAPDSKRIYFTGPDTADGDEKSRREKRFTVNVRNAETPRSNLWAVDLDPIKVSRLTNDPSVSVEGFVVSRDGKWVGYNAVDANRYRRNITEAGINADLFLMETATGSVERLTNNREVGEGPLSFSPDGRWVAFSAPNDLTRYSMSNRRVYVRAVGEKGGAFRKMGESFDGDVSVDFWSADGNTVYFNEGVKATNQLLALDMRTNSVKQLTSFPAALQVGKDDETGLMFVNYSDPTTPSTVYTVPSVEKIGTKTTWTQLTDANPQVRRLALGEEREIMWRSKDGKMVGGVLVLPVGYAPGQRYPLIVAIHGGPAAADVMSFNGGYGAQVYAGAGYAVLKPNYRGSTNYGEAHRNGIVGNYFPPGYDDIMTGVDTLIAQGIVDGNKMGVLGWSAGGHWSNWILTHTDRFKAISSGAGTSNWISMYAQSDVQRNRQYYLGDKLPYEDFDAYWNQSPLKYITNAKTPTMIHVVEGDPRVPSPQSIELHMALKKLGVPTELYLYPGASHGIPDPRNRLVKSVAEMAWMDYWVRGNGKQFAWRDVLKTLEPGTGPSTMGGDDR